MQNLPLEVRSSPVHGSGVFATRRIRKNSRIIEYQGERISLKEADVRYEEDPSAHPIVLLFTVNKRIYIDAEVGGNEARYINHSCAPNCEAVITEGRIFIHALRTIATGEELSYDYNLEHDAPGDDDPDGRYACCCGAENCRGTMLAPAPKVKSRRRKKVISRA